MWPGELLVLVRLALLSHPLKPEWSAIQQPGGLRPGLFRFRSLFLPE